MTTSNSIQAAAAIINRPWLIMQSALPKLASAIASAPSRSESLDEITLADFFEIRPPSYTIQDKDQDGNPQGPMIGVVHIHQALVDSCPPIYEKLGFMTSYPTLEREIEGMLQAGADGLLLVHDSPGGTVQGNREIAELVADLEIPVVSYALGLMCSASYKIAAGSDKIIASPSAVVGNIGSILSWANLEEFWRSMGVRFEALTSEGADLKSTFHTEPDLRQREFLQEGINESGRQFREHVSAGREAAGATLDPEVFRAGWYSGETAIALGLVDGIGDVSGAMQLLRELIDTP